VSATTQPYSAAPDRYEHMTYAKCGNSGLILRRAFDLGVTHFDIANNYGPPAGSAETNFGRIFAEDFRPHRDELLISSKAGYHQFDGPYGEWGSRKYLLGSLDASLTRTGLDYFDIFYSHRPDPDTPVEETMGALAHAVRSGKALYAGISNYSPEQTRAAATALTAEGVPLLIHQPRYNMFDRHIENGLFPVLDEVGAGSIVFSPLAQGMLTDRYLDGIPADSRAAEGRWISASNISDAYLEHARALNEIAKGRGQTLAQLALTWVLRHAQVTSALIGASSVAQLESSLGALTAAPLTVEELAAIEPHAVDGLTR
jgi:L-glyceraldehyde 3-phosphate reductase